MGSLDRWFKIAIVGSRLFNDCRYIYKVLTETVLPELQVDSKQVLIVTGGARGVDSCAEYIAKEVLKCPVLVFPANWFKYGKKAGMIRNTYIAEVADIVLAFPTKESRGTWDTVNKAKRLGKKVFMFEV